MISSSLNLVTPFYEPPMAVSQHALDAVTYLPSKPYYKPLAAGMTAQRAMIWVGFRNRVLPFQHTDDLAVTVPIGNVQIHGLNTATFRPAIGNTSGVAPRKRVYTGVGG